MAVEGLEPNRLGLFNSHHRLATPVSPWEMLKIGGGTPPILTRHGWLIIYHSVSEMAEPDNDGRQLCYSAGVMVLSKEPPRVILYRSTEPMLTPELPQERRGTIANVVFPTGIDRRDLAPRTASTFITGWPTTGLAWPALVCQISCRQEDSPTRWEQKSKFSPAVNLKEHRVQTMGSCSYREHRHCTYARLLAKFDLSRFKI